MQVSHNVPWPGRMSSNGGWDDLRKIIDTMKLGEAVSIELESDKEVDAARKAAQGYARDVLNCKDSNWQLSSTKRKNTLYLLKRAS